MTRLIIPAGENTSR